jgi:Protein of unknown function (DUF2283)
MVAVRDKIARIPPAVDYDRHADVLYVSLGKPVPDEGEDRPRGVVLRFSTKDDHPTGVTVIGYRRNGWSNDLQALSRLIALHLTINPNGVLQVLEGVNVR